MARASPRAPWRVAALGMAAAGALVGAGGPAVAAERAAVSRAPAEWLAVARRETDAQKRTESPSRRRLLASAARALHPHGQGPDSLVQREAGRRRQYEPFLTWFEREGRARLAKWRRGEQLSADERRHLPLLHGIRLFRYRGLRRKLRRKAKLTPDEQETVAYGNAVVKRGEALLRKGYLGGSLTRAELHGLWVYALWLDIRNTGGGVLPFHLGLASGYRGRRPPIGQPAPDFTLVRMEAALKSPDYSDLNPKDPAGLLRPASPFLQELLLAMGGYEPVPGAKPPRVRAKPIAVPEGRETDYVRLSDFRGKRPVLLVLANATDAWAWHWRLAPMLEPLHQAYRDRIAFFFIHTTIHDAHMPVKDFFGPEPGRHDAVHEVALWQRARACKMFYMDHPQCTVPYLLDDMAQRTRNAYRDQGGGAYFVLVDLDGRVAYVDYHQDIPPHWGQEAVAFPYDYLTIRMNHLESRLKSFAANGCRYAKTIETPYPTWRGSPEATARRVEAARDGEAARGRGATIWLAGRITSVDGKARLLTVERHKPEPAAMKGWGFWQAAGDRATPFDAGTKARLAVVRKWIEGGEAARTYRFVVDDAVDIFLDGCAVPPDALRAGDCVGVLYRTWRDGQARVCPEQVRAFRPPADWSE